MQQRVEAQQLDQRPDVGEPPLTGQPLVTLLQEKRPPVVQLPLVLVDDDAAALLRPDHERRLAVLKPRTESASP